MPWAIAIAVSGWTAAIRPMGIAHSSSAYMT